ncbi:MBL fold metallo-hydrolase [Thermanaeromonas sp. C210]|uniref:MBL fold metallo-hydrolase n=1 Tax=Thermanaeromonas sp. C210 TaxID=2731925 RepID=UPI00155BCE11|nr:MBL fold metallo-hydrolase [Thermanaeromonas sp. C210]GFN24164.1 MBL fold metallo-hydrolase [Thermanaeromonas sp. C210]
MIRLVGAFSDGELYLIELAVGGKGFRKFIGPWLLRIGDRRLLVDPGPAVGLPFLVAALRELGTNRLDYILLTHIHLDHAGAVGGLLDYFPESAVFAHPRAREFLESPTRLWESNVKVLRELTYFSGPMKPVPAERLVEQVPEIRVIETPGHAPYHLSFLWRNFLFAGEAAGVYLDMGDGFYLRPSTPTKFSFETAVLSLETLLRLAGDDTTICFGHFGWASRGKTMLNLARQQLYRWEAIIIATCRRVRVREEREWLSLLGNELLSRDPLLRGFERLEPDIRRRERYFLENNLKGYLEYLIPTSLRTVRIPGQGVNQ